MAHVYAFQSHPIYGQDLAVLQAALGQWCTEKNIELSDPRAQEAAVELIDWFQFGLRYPDQLIEMLRRSDH